MCQSIRVWVEYPISVVIALVAISSFGCGGNGPVETLTMGASLNSAMDKVNSAISQAREAGRLVEVQAGNEAAIAIENMRIAYNDSLDKTIDKIDQKAKTNLATVQQMVEQVEKKTEADAKSALSQAQQITNTLPLSNKLPQVREYGPKYMVSKSLQPRVHLKVEGNFPQLVEVDNKPYLDYCDKRYQPSEALTQRLIFDIPRGEASPSGNTIKYATATLVVPYKTMLGVKKQGTFLLSLGTVPFTPGTITITSKRVKDSVERQHIVTQEWQQHSSNDDHKDVVHTSAAYPGWRVVPESVKFVVKWKQGNENDQWSKRLVSTDNGRVVYNVTTIYHRIGTSGKVNFQYEFDIERHRQIEEMVNEKIELTWGESRIFPYKLGSWTVTFNDFKGVKQEFAGPSTASPFLAVSVEGETLKLAAPMLDTLRRP